MSVPPELRVTDRDVVYCPRIDIACRACGGTGIDTRPGLCGPVVNWCDECWGSAFWSATILPMGASVRLGAMLAEGLRWTAPWWDVSTW